MAKKPRAQPKTKSEFLRELFDQDIDLDHAKANARWAKARYPGEFSKSLFFKVRRDLGIRTVWSRAANEPDPTSPVTVPPGEVFTIKITLLETKPPIWRRIQISDVTLDILHVAIQTAMGWTNSHLHMFVIDGQTYTEPSPWSMPDEDFESIDSSTIRLGEIPAGRSGKTRFRYEYDFGDGWLHDIQIEARRPADPGKRPPICLGGARACPPEDVGGAWRYADFIAIMSNRRHERYREMNQWYERKFEPEAFDPRATTELLR